MDYYRDIVTKHNGQSNAMTMFDKTCYYFNVNKEGLMETLDIFAQFFICSTFEKQWVDKEILAVNSEHNKNLTSDPHKEYQIKRYLSKKGSIYHKFQTGNLDTL